MNKRLSELSKPVQIFKHPTGRNFWAVMADSTAGQNGVEPFYSQEYVSALLADNEAKDKRIAELEEQNIQLKKELQNEGTANAHAYERIRGLEKRLATPVRLLGEMLVHDWEHRVDRQAAFEHRKIAWDARLAEDKKAILAAGFTFTVEGDE